MAKNTGSETMGAAGEKGRMTLFKDDRSEDMGAIFLAAIVISVVMVLTMRTSDTAADAPADNPAAASVPADAPAAK